MPNNSEVANYWRSFEYQLSFVDFIWESLSFDTPTTSAKLKVSGKQRLATAAGAYAPAMTS